MTGSWRDEGVLHGEPVSVGEFMDDDHFNWGFSVCRWSSDFRAKSFWKIMLCPFECVRILSSLMKADCFYLLSLFTQLRAIFRPDKNVLARLEM